MALGAALIKKEVAWEAKNESLLKEVNNVRARLETIRYERDGVRAAVHTTETRMKEVWCRAGFLQLLCSCLLYYVRVLTYSWWTLVGIRCQQQWPSQGSRTTHRTAPGDITYTPEQNDQDARRAC